MTAPTDDQPDVVARVGAELFALRARVAELEPLEQRARHLAATPGLDGAARTYAHAGRYVLGLAQEVGR